MINISPDKNDDKDFLRLVEQILNVGVGRTEPEDVFITKIDHWFDFKWRRFSHKIFGALGIWREPLRIPPFIPDRVIEEIYLRKEGKNYRRKHAYPLHIYQASDNNAQRKIKCKSAVYLWFSSNTINNSQGCVMVYTFAGDFQKSWYVSFLKKSDWQIYKTDNTSKSEVQAILENDYLALIR